MKASNNNFTADQTSCFEPQSPSIENIHNQFDSVVRLPQGFYRIHLLELSACKIVFFVRASNWIDNKFGPHGDHILFINFS